MTLPELSLERLTKLMLHYSWQREAEIIPYYMPPYPHKDTRPICVVKWNNSFLRHSRGPRQGYSWDCYGDDFQCPELALLALYNAPPPALAKAIPIIGYS